MSIKKGMVVFLSLVALFAYITARTHTTPPAGTHSRTLHVVASFYPLSFFATRVGGSKAEVFTLTPASGEPHDYEPTTQDIVRITNSNMLILNGGNLEPWGEKIKEQLRGTHVLIVTAGNDSAHQTIVEEGKTIRDPHVWQDPLLAKQEVDAIEKGYEKLDPKDAVYFQENAKHLNSQLDELDNAFKQGLTNCQKRDFITSHAAFGYLATRYHMHQIAISGVSPDEEPSSQKMAEIADLIKRENIKTIFFETLVSPKLSQTIAEETGAQTQVLDPIEGLTDDDLKAGKNYLTVMRDNLSALQKALQCTM